MTYRLLMVFMLCAGRVLAQGEFKPGTIRTLDNEVQIGYIRVLEPILANQQCIFKETDESKEIRYTPDQLLGYGFLNGAYYSSTTIRKNGDTTLLFVERLSAGVVSLYQYFDQFILERSGESSKQLTDENFKTVLKETLTDCPYISSKISRIRLERSSITRLIDDYNICSGGDADSFDGTHRIKVAFGGTIGTENSSVEFETSKSKSYLNGLKLKNSFSVAAGFSILFRVPDVSKKLSLRTGLVGYFGEYAGTHVFNFGNTTSQISFRQLDIQVPLSVQYELISRNRISLLATMSIAISSTSLLSSFEMIDTKVGSGVYLDEDELFMSSRRNPQLGLGISCGYRLPNKKKLILDIGRFSGSQEFILHNNKEGVDAKSNRATFSLSYFFK